LVHADFVVRLVHGDFVVRLVHGDFVVRLVHADFVVRLATGYFGLCLWANRPFMHEKKRFKIFILIVASKILPVLFFNKTPKFDNNFQTSQPV